MFSQGSVQFAQSTCLTPTAAENPSMLKKVRFQNPMNDFEIASAPDDTVSALAFSPPSVEKNFLIAGSWDSSARCWEVEQSGNTIPKSVQSMQGPILDVCWHNDGNKVFIASTDKLAKCWDLVTNQSIQVAAHEAPIKTCHWIKSPQYSCLMTGSWDKTLKFWDTRSPKPMLTINLNHKCFAADVDYPMAVVATSSREIIFYKLDTQPREYQKIGSPLKHQSRCIAILKDSNKSPKGFALGSIAGKVAIHYVDKQDNKRNFSFKCHRMNPSAPGGFQEVYPVNDVKFHPVHESTLATVGSDGVFSFWDKEKRTKLKSSEAMEQAITKCAFNKDGQIFAYSVGYDWAKGHEFYDATKKNYIFLRPCFQDLQAQSNAVA
ncbi:hypothetical protein LSTR_LSTR000393 [Laodelphax striatellus]|uniref:Uncharacterized protein n=1 Tax=Laodelphax striatellus TaxID=195883 RepID=A0A482X413_LAOST|nr:hypothetical protein LSTR_LSTR000393 [Laodelphax striatellus]